MAGYVSSLFSTAISLILLIGVIFVRPQGLLGRTRGARMDVAERTSGRIYAPPKLPRGWLPGARGSRWPWLCCSCRR